MTKRATCVHFIDSFKSVLLAWQNAKIIGRKGYGGKLKEKQDPRKGARIEVRQEAGYYKKYRVNRLEQGGIDFDPKDLIPVALIDFYNGNETEVPQGNPSFRVIFYNCYKFRGIAIDTKEMRDAAFYPIDNLPIDELPKGDELFLQDILEGKMIIAEMRRTEDFQSVISWKWRPCTREELVI